MNLLFVCTDNRMRSPTAQQIYEEDERYTVKSAGTAPDAVVPLSASLLEWADSIVVMEKRHRNWIRKRFPHIYATKKIVCLYIPDEYDNMQSELINLIRSRFENVYQHGLI